jgi:hypothetical protein
MWNNLEVDTYLVRHRTFRCISQINVHLHALFIFKASSVRGKSKNRARGWRELLPLSLDNFLRIVSLAF